MAIDALDPRSLTRLQALHAELSARSYPRLFTANVGTDKPLEWRIGSDTTVVTDCKAIVMTDLVQRGYVMFEHNRLVGQYWRAAIGQEPMPRPPGHEDESRWERWPGSDRPRDPWQRQYRVPVRILTGDAAGQIAVYTGSTEITKAVIAEVVANYILSHRRPHVLLTSVREPGKAFLPMLEVLPGWVSLEPSPRAVIPPANGQASLPDDFEGDDDPF